MPWSSVPTYEPCMPYYFSESCDGTMCFLCSGSGKSYLAKALRDVELMNGGTAPRIHSIDDYFMTEVEKV